MPTFDNNNFEDTQDDPLLNETSAGNNIQNTILNDENSDWEIVVNSNETFADGQSGTGSDILRFSINSIHLMKIKMHITSELCTACGGIGKGEVTVAIIMPSGEIAYQDIYTQSADLNLLQTYPQEGEWQIIIEGIAIGEDYKIGYSATVLTIEDAKE